MALGNKGNFYSLSDGTTLYSWSDTTTFGVKMNMADVSKTAEDLKKSNPSLADTNIDMSKDYNFTCTDWVVDPSKFAVPTGIQFMDIADFTKSLQNLIPSVSPGQ
jgi:hypothetical protein